ncbi:putative sugar transporter [Sarocladium strictum]
MASGKYLGLRGTRLRAAMLLLVIAPSFMLFGYNNGSTGGITTLHSFVSQFPDLDTITTTGSQKSHNATIKGVVVGCYDLGAVTGCLLAIAYSDRIGRLKTILLGLVLSIIALAIESSAYSLAQFIVGRLLIGGAIGTISSSVPIWQAECSSSSHRGAFVVIEGLFISAGITMSEWISFGFSFASSGPVQWRVPLAFPAIFAIFVIPFVMTMPESPRWLARVGRLEEARSVLAALADEDEHSESVNEDMRKIEHSLGLIKGKVAEIFHNGEERVSHRTGLACWGLMASSLTTFQTLCAFVPLFLIDRLGRRPMFMISGMGLSICMAVLAGTGGLKGSGSDAAVVFVFLYQFFYPFGFLGQTFLYATEVAPLRLRVPIMAVANGVQWMSQFVVAQVTPPGTINLGSHYYIIYAVLNFFFVIVFYFFFPETNGLSLEDVDEVFKASNNVFDTVGVAKEMIARGVDFQDDHEVQKGRLGRDNGSSDAGEPKGTEHAQTLEHA